MLGSPQEVPQQPGAGEGSGTGWGRDGRQEEGLAEEASFLMDQLLPSGHGSGSICARCSVHLRAFQTPASRPRNPWVPPGRGARLDGRVPPSTFCQA